MGMSKRQPSSGQRQVIPVVGWTLPLIVKAFFRSAIDINCAAFYARSILGTYGNGEIMHLFIFSENGDAHAVVVTAALRSAGITVSRFLADQFPIAAEISCQLDNGGENIKFRQSHGIDQFFSEQQPDVVWLRRPALPVVNEARLHPDDIPTAQSESREFWQAFLAYSFSAANWINPWESAKKCRSKLLQLSLATQCGFLIPRSLISNAAGDIRAFIRKIESTCQGGVVVKSFFPVKWQNDHGVKMMYTAKVAIDMLPSDELLCAVPAIYQEQIPKAFEVRSTFFGRAGFHVKIRAEKDGEQLQDWRFGHYSGLDVAVHSLPVAIEQKCIALMARLNIKFGCFDFIVRPDGEYVFLEVNEAGQFLWVEKYCPDLKMLNAFCQFILAEGGQPVGDDFPCFDLETVSNWPHVRETINQERLRLK